MTEIKGANNPGNSAHVDDKGRIEAHATSITEQSDASLDGNSYNLNTGTFLLTSDVLTPIFFLKNDAEERALIIPRIFVTFGASTGGVGEIEATILYNPTGGTIITAGIANPPQNFNAGSSKTLKVISNTGVTGDTIVGGTKPIEFLFPSAGARHLVGFEAIVLPRGGSLIFSVTPPAGNTSMKIQAGTNIYVAERKADVN